jgi:ankyrin repeat protein
MSGKTPLTFAAALGYQSVMNRLIENGADCNAADIYGRTPLSPLHSLATSVL